VDGIGEFILASLWLSPQRPIQSAAWGCAADGGTSSSHAHLTGLWSPSLPSPSPHAGRHNPDRRSHSRCSCSRLSKFRGVAPSVLVWRGFGSLCSSVWRRRGSRGWLGMLSLLNGPAVGFSPSPIVLQSGVASIGQAGTCRTQRLEPSGCGRSAGLSWLLSVFTPRVPSGAASQIQEWTREPPHSRCQ
jgi:hypothetical protein